MSKELLTYNERGALSHVLAVEEHLAQLPPGVNNSWCAEKHSLAAVDHHLSEAVNHASRAVPQRAHLYRSLRAKAERILKPSAPGSLPRLQDVANLRNEMRAVFGDPTLNDKSCSVCSKDKPMHPLHPRHPYANGVPAMYGMGAERQAPVPWYNNPLLILVGVGALFWVMRPR